MNKIPTIKNIDKLQIYLLQRGVPKG